MKDQFLFSNKNVKLFLAISMFALIGGYFYVMALGLGYRAYIFIHGSVLFFLGLSMFLRNIKVYLIFTMMVGISLGLGRHFIHDKVPFEASLFSQGVRIDSVEVVLIVCYVNWGLTLIRNPNSQREITVGGNVGRAFLAWILYVFVSSLFSAQRLDFSIYEVIVYVKGFLFYFYLINNINNNNELKIMIYGLCGSGMLLAIYMIVQYLTKTSYTLSGELSGVIGPEGFRSRGFTGTPDGSVAMLVIVFQLLFAGLLFSKNMLKKSIIVTSIFLIVLGMIFSKVRIIFASLSLGVFTTLFFTYLRGWISKGQALIAVMAIVLAALAVTPVVYERFATGVYGEDRWPLMVTAYQMFSNNTLLGVGTNNYNFEVSKYIPPLLSREWLFTVHNEYLLRLSETGIFGFVLYYYLIIIVTVRLYKSTFIKTPLIFLVSCGLLASMVGSFVQRLVSIYDHEPLFMIYCSIYALSVIVGSLDQENNLETIPQNKI